MRFYKKLYISTALQKKKRQVVRKLKAGKKQPFLYVIALSEQNDLMEIYHSLLLQQPYYHKNPPYIIGLAESYDSAVSLVQTILMDVYALTGGYDVKAFCYQQKR